MALFLGLAHLIACAGMTFGPVETHSRLIMACTFMEVHLSTHPTLIAPHGGTLVDRVAKPGAAMKLAAEAATAPKIALSERALCDVICIATGAYSPLEGFMGSADYNSVVDGMRLVNGTIWPIPIVLPIEESLASRLKAGDKAALVDTSFNMVAIIDISEIYHADHARETTMVYGTSDREHPGVAAVLEAPPHYCAGKITLIAMPKPDY